MRAALQVAREAEHRFPVRIRIGIPREGLGSRLDQMNAWLDANCGADGWTSTPSSTRGVVTDALAVYFLDATIASAFVARWCAAQRIEIVDGVYRVRDRRADIPPWKRACTRRPDRHPYLSSVVGALTGTPLPIPLFPKEGNYKE
jgi:hypothetical protein